jgi:hypothetical protein
MNKNIIRISLSVTQIALLFVGLILIPNPLRKQHPFLIAHFMQLAAILYLFIARLTEYSSTASGAYLSKRYEYAYIYDIFYFTHSFVHVLNRGMEHAIAACPECHHIFLDVKAVVDHMWSNCKAV